MGSQRVGHDWATEPNWTVLVAQLGPTLCDPMDCSLSGSSVHGILQARILKWVAMPFSRVSSWSRDQILVSIIEGRLSHFSHQGSPLIYIRYKTFETLKHWEKKKIITKPTPKEPPFQSLWHYLSFIYAKVLCSWEHLSTWEQVKPADPELSNLSAFMYYTAQIIHFLFVPTSWAVFTELVGSRVGKLVRCKINYSWFSWWNWLISLLSNICKKLLYVKYSFTSLKYVNSKQIYIALTM